MYHGTDTGASGASNRMPHTRHRGTETEPVSASTLRGTKAAVWALLLEYFSVYYIQVVLFIKATVENQPTSKHYFSP